MSNKNFTINDIHPGDYVKLKNGDIGLICFNRRQNETIYDTDDKGINSAAVIQQKNYLRMPLAPLRSSPNLLLKLLVIQIIYVVTTDLILFTNIFMTLLKFVD